MGGSEKNDSINLANEILSRNKKINSSIKTNNIDNLNDDSIKFRQNIVKIKSLILILD